MTKEKYLRKLEEAVRNKIGKPYTRLDGSKKYTKEFPKGQEYIIIRDGKVVSYGINKRK